MISEKLLEECKFKFNQKRRPNPNPERTVKRINEVAGFIRIFPMLYQPNLRTLSNLLRSDNHLFACPSSHEQQDDSALAFVGIGL